MGNICSALNTISPVRMDNRGYQSDLFFSPLEVGVHQQPEEPTRWAVLKQIGTGACGTVHLAQDLDTGKEFALKKIEIRHDLQGPEAESRLSRLLREVENTKYLDHKNIVKFLGYEEVKEGLATRGLNIFMEYVPGQSLQTLLDNGSLEEEKVQDFTRQILTGLHYLHKEKVVHRDIKPANILIRNDDMVLKLADFGVSKKIADDCTAKGTQSLEGTPNFIAPEVWLAEHKNKPYSYSADIWSTGCTVYQMLTGDAPWTGCPEEAIAWQAAEARPTTPPNVSPICRHFLQQCFTKDATLRPSAEELLKHPWLAVDPVPQAAFSTPAAQVVRAFAPDFISEVSSATPQQRPAVASPLRQPTPSSSMPPSQVPGCASTPHSATPPSAMSPNRGTLPVASHVTPACSGAPPVPAHGVRVSTPHINIRNPMFDAESPPTSQATPATILEDEEELASQAHPCVPNMLQSDDSPNMLTIQVASAQKSVPLRHEVVMSEDSREDVLTPMPLGTAQRLLQQGYSRDSQGRWSREQMEHSASKIPANMSVTHLLEIATQVVDGRLGSANDT